MKLPIRLSSINEGELAAALNAVAQRLDRLIELSEQTNELIRSASPVSRPETQPLSRADRPQTARAVRQARPYHPNQASSRPRRGESRSPGAHRGAGLHDAIEAVLREAGEPLTAAEITRRINDRRLFVPRRSGKQLSSSQVNSRISHPHYRNRFRRENGRVAVAANSEPGLTQAL